MEQDGRVKQGQLLIDLNPSPLNPNVHLALLVIGWHDVVFCGHSAVQCMHRQSTDVVVVAVQEKP